MYTMRDHYDLSKMKQSKNPYARFLKKTITIRLDPETIEYFKALAERTGLPYQSLINLYLRDCAARRKKLSMQWASVGEVREAMKSYTARSGSSPPRKRAAKKKGKN
jgi:antitoxin component of RelBE/YafQ-DinJ toxin-antitoxin module